MITRVIYIVPAAGDVAVFLRAAPTVQGANHSPQNPKTVSSLGYRTLHQRTIAVIYQADDGNLRMSANRTGTKVLTKGQKYIIHAKYSMKTKKYNMPHSYDHQTSIKHLQIKNSG